ncbi:MAG: VanZ family protein [Desulfopila sp.]
MSKPAAITRTKLPPWARMLPMFAVMAGIFYLSHQPGDDFDVVEIAHLDKVVHFLLYGVLAAATLYGLSPKFRRNFPIKAAVATFVICACYGMVDEFHQSFIAGRFPSIMDLVADMAGALSICLLWCAKKRKGSHLNY